jgi:hypothetical protein
MSVKKKSEVAWIYKHHLVEPNWYNFNVYPRQPSFPSGKLDEDFIKVRITIEEVK